MDYATEHVDVVIVGAGISGIAAAVALQSNCPDKSFLLLEMRAGIGGTWDLFRYPGIRSDSDMFTLGFGFKPWTDEKAIASGAAILDYLVDTVTEYRLESHLRLQRRVVAASWSTADRAWTLTVEGPAGTETMSCGFVYMAAGYFDYERGHAPDLPGRNRFCGPVVHPQSWPQDLECRGQDVVVLGSGATAITLVPALADEGARVTMIQRSPTYIAIDSDVDEIANELRDTVGPSEAFSRIRLRNLAQQQERFHRARTDPEGFKKPLFAVIDEIVGEQMREDHFTPAYEPWDQRLCLAPRGDLFHVIREGRARVVTGVVDTLTETGVLMRSGETVPADIIVTATGLRLVTLGKVSFTVDGERVDFSRTWTYKGVAFSGVPNLVQAFGYINSSWTLRIEIVNEFWCSILNRMDQLGATLVVPELRVEDGDMAARPWIEGVSSGYLLRSMGMFPHQGDRAPWVNPQVHDETVALLSSDPEDGVLRFAE